MRRYEDSFLAVISYHTILRAWVVAVRRRCQHHFVFLFSSLNHVKSTHAQMSRWSQHLLI